MKIPNPNNGYVPKPGEHVRVVGACHPAYQNKVVEVVSVFDEDGNKFCETKILSNRHGYLTTTGIVGGFEPAHDSPVSFIDD